MTLTEVGILVAIGTSIGGVLFNVLRSSFGRGVAKQTVESRLKHLEEWKGVHDGVAARGMEELTRLKVGMSDGAQAGFNRVEEQLERILDATNTNAIHIAQVSGQVSALADTVGQLVERGLEK